MFFYTDIKLSPNLSKKDVASNIDKFRDLCARHVCTSVFALRSEDFIYKAPELKNNMLDLLCEIFIRVELEKDKSTTEEYSETGESLSGIESDAIIHQDYEKGDDDSEDFDDAMLDSYLDKDLEESKMLYLSGHSRVNEAEGRQKENVSGEISNPTTNILDSDYELKRSKHLGMGSHRNVLDSDSSKPPPAVLQGMGTKIRQPLLSKRSKKQLEQFEDKNQSNEHLPGKFS